MTYRVVSFTTDYGSVDGFVAACKGVLLDRAPGVTIVDVTHHVPPGDVRRGAAVLAQTLPWLPAAVHVAVVDPGVGTDRRGVAVVAGRGILVGPDNGLLPPAADALGGITAAYELADPAHHLPVVSATFHGRDVFAPVAAALCRGLDPSALGPPVADLVRLPAPVVRVRAGELRAEVLSVDGFGNVQLAATAADLAAAGLTGPGRGPARPEPNGPGRTPAGVAGTEPPGPDGTAAGPTGGLRVNGVVAVLGRTFADVPAGELVVLTDSAGQLAVAANRGDAAAALGLTPGTVVEVSRSGPP